jgi:uncharacterized protein (TIGR00369 family)
MADGKVPHPPMTDTVPMRIKELTKGSIRFVVKADERHINSMGGVHGGFIATVLDTTTGCAIHTMLEAGVGYGTVDLSVKMLRPIPLGIDLLAEGRAIHVSKSIGVSEGTIKDSAGKIYAHGTCTCRIFRPQEP